MPLLASSEQRWFFRVISPFNLLYHEKRLYLACISGDFRYRLFKRICSDLHVPV